MIQAPSQRPGPPGSPRRRCHTLCAQSRDSKPCMKMVSGSTRIRHQRKMRRGIRADVRQASGDDELAVGLQCDAAGAKMATAANVDRHHAAHAKIRSRLAVCVKAREHDAEVAAVDGARVGRRPASHHHAWVRSTRVPDSLEASRSRRCRCCRNGYPGCHRRATAPATAHKYWARRVSTGDEHAARRQRQQRRCRAFAQAHLHARVFTEGRVVDICHQPACGRWPRRMESVLARRHPQRECAPMCPAPTPAAR